MPTPLPSSISLAPASASTPTSALLNTKAQPPVFPIPSSARSSHPFPSTSPPTPTRAIPARTHRTHRSDRGHPNPGTGDRHVLVLDSSNCFLYEMDRSYPETSVWNADSAAVWDLLANEQRPYSWTSADAAGPAIFPGLVRYDEVAAGQIAHAIRFTLQHSKAAFIPPPRTGQPIPATLSPHPWAWACASRPASTSPASRLPIK
jgi:hypothetical protein